MYNHQTVPLVMHTIIQSTNDAVAAQLIKTSRPAVVAYPPQSLISGAF